MAKRPVLLLAVILLATLGVASCVSHQSSGLGTATPEDIGLTWQECAVFTGFDWEQAESCFGHPMPLWHESESANLGTRLNDNMSLHLTIGQDVYRASLSGRLLLEEQYTLYKNDQVVYSLYGKFTAYPPSVSLRNVGGKAVWEFSDGNTATVIYDGSDVRQLYGLDKAYKPYGLGGRLIVIGQKNDRYFVVYDGWKVGPDFDQISIAYCCEPVLWSVQGGQGRYLFWGSRDGQWYVVELALQGK